MPLRWTTRPCFPSYLLLCRTKRRFYLETCLKSTTSTRGERVSSIWSTSSQTDASINNSSLLSTFSLVLTSFYYWQDISKRAGAVHWLSRIGWKMFSAEGERLMTAARVLLLLKNSYSHLFFFTASLQMTDLQIYEKYCHNKPRSESLWRQCSDCAFFQVDKQDFTEKKRKTLLGLIWHCSFPKTRSVRKSWSTSWA